MKMVSLSGVAGDDVRGGKIGSNLNNIFYNQMVVNTARNGR
jgi:hypothetical protein